MDFRRLTPFNSDAAQGVLARLAWWMHQEDERSTAPLQELEQEAELELKKLAESAGLGREGKAFIVRMREESGILALGGEGSRKCGFLLLSFQEYLAASYAVQRGFAKHLAARIGNSWWQEAALLSLRNRSPSVNNSSGSCWRRGWRKRGRIWCSAV